MPGKETATMTSTRNTRQAQIVIVAIILISILSLAYWQFVLKPGQQSKVVETIYAGRVIDANSQLPVSGAKVTFYLNGVVKIAYTDSEGIYQFGVTVNSEMIGQIRVDAKGYQPYTLNISLFSNIRAIEDIRLVSAPLPQATEPSDLVIVTAASPTPPLIEKSVLTDKPVELAVPAGPSLLRQDCFDINIWTPYKKDNLLSKDMGCWNLSAWGFTAREKEIVVVPPISNDGKFHGIYTPIKNNSEISFKIRVDKLDVDSSVTANIGIGIINLEPVGPATSRLVYYHYIPRDSEFYIPMKTGVDAKYQNSIPMVLNFSTPQKVSLKVDGPFLTMIFDDKTEMGLTIPFDKRAFWVSYSLPPGSELIMSIYDLEIK